MTIAINPLSSLLHARLRRSVSTGFGEAAKPPSTPSPDGLTADRLCNCSTLSIFIGEERSPQKPSPNHQIAFNLHNSYLDHRDRGKRLRLPSYHLIENASQTNLTYPDAVVREAFPMLASGDPTATPI